MGIPLKPMLPISKMSTQKGVEIIMGQHQNQSYENYHFNLVSMQTNQQTNQKLNDKKSEELRILAFEYVKQIVAKANELSQIHNASANDSHRLENGTKAPSTTMPTKNSNASLQAESKGSNRTHLIDTTTKKLVRDAAVQINENFQSIKTPPASNKQGVCLGTAAQSNAAYRPGLKQYSDGITEETSKLSMNYIEQDYATMSSSQEDGSSRQGHRNGTRTRTRQRFKGFSQHLNWHLLVSCFSTCLPETLVETAREHAAAGQASGGPSTV